MALSKSLLGWLPGSSLGIIGCLAYGRPGVIGAKPACEVADLWRLVRHPLLAVNVWLDLDAFAKGLQIDKTDLANEWRDHFGRPKA